MRALLAKFRDGLTRTARGIADKTKALLGGGAIDTASLEALEEALYTADFGVATTTEILEEIKCARREDRELRGQDAAALGAAVLRRALAGSEGRLESGARVPGGSANPTVICLIGVNGSGKTTTAAKLAWLLKQDGGAVTVAACDTFRAAAIEQLRTWTQRLDLELIAGERGADAAAVAYDAWQAAKARGRGWLVIDTAGRLHTKSNLMEELAKIRRVLQKNDPAAPQHAWLVIDGSLGANSIEQARIFHQSFGLTGIVVTKLDGTSRGGAIVGIWRELKLPIYFVGLGEQAEDLQPFSAEIYARAVFGLEA
ncbi:MAG TPA: signal recognition particle-docking protein FtsY [Opitutaceae bacterium]|nr:signal recognition particle-docking protein FtsY [Opitutaceae bacterium]